MAAPTAPVHTSLTLVESSAGWQLTLSGAETLRAALEADEAAQAIQVAVRISPNLVPGEQFEATLVIDDLDGA
jgi:hypothetical protein